MVTSSLRFGKSARVALLLLVGISLLASTAAIDAPGGKPSSKPKKQTLGNYAKLFLRPSKSEADIDAYAFVIPGKIGWAAKTSFYFGLWYFFNIFYNVANKKALNALNLPWMQSLACVGVGTPYIGLLWLLGIQAAPKLTSTQFNALAPSIACHSAGNVGGNIAFGSGALGFAHVLKSMEPAFTAIFSGVITGKWKSLYEYAALLPIMGGVAYASASELNFNMLQFVSAMVSNVGFSLRSVWSKEIMSWDRSVTKMDGPNTFRVLQVGSTLLTIPFVLAVEGWRALFPWTHPNWKAAIGKLDHAGQMITPAYLWSQIILSGLAFQLYYEASYLALDAVTPITYSVGNNIKRIVIVITSVIVFGQKMNTQSIIGSGIALGGVFAYSMISDYFANQAKAAASARKN
eukprot:CAMPEP_0113679144 /NCGR_PEP_ID=MMETSP0038_2-20120614/10418_1 /TAXON_ID=2898 /ORGANISM="Cryptomonas paramecium" /LENGTH=403 /DNA_ID=CAMNT_0000597017 /DNA_START=109 /DNA_END=1320 /DNA_ORIENTATION=+ /assembly_acc=CAM_ASM_000170